MFSWECCEISKNIFFTKHLWITACAIADYLVLTYLL